MKSLKLLLPTLLLSSFLFFNSCMGTCFVAVGEAKNKAEKTFTAENNAIPLGFGKDKNTVPICLQQGLKKSDKHMKKNFEEHYNGKYVLVKEPELTSGQYNDTNTCRYLLKYDRESKYVGNTLTGICEYHIYDHKENVEYKSGHKSPYFREQIKAYAINFEKARQGTG